MKTLLNLCAITLGVFSILAAGNGEAIIYVSANQTNQASPDGLSWRKAFPSVQQGLDAANAGDQVWVAAATYFENITLKDGVALFGGFAGTEADVAQRN